MGICASLGYLGHGGHRGHRGDEGIPAQSHKRETLRMMVKHVAAAAFSLIVVAPIVWMGLDRRPPFTVVAGEVVPDEIRPGGTYRIKWSIINPPRRCRGTVQRALIDSQKVVWIMVPYPSLFGQSIVTTDLKPNAFVGRVYKMPDAIAPGPVIIRTALSFECNFTQKWMPIEVGPIDIQARVLPKTAIRPDAPSP